MGKAPKILIKGQDLVDPMLKGQGNQMRIMHQIPCDPALAKDLTQDSLMRGRLGKDLDRRGLQEAGQRFHGFIDRGRRIEDLVVRDHPQELIETGPKERIRSTAFAVMPQQVNRGFVVGSALAVGIDKDIRVERYHRLPPVQEIEQLIAVVEIDPRHNAATDGLEAKDVFPV